MNHLYAFAVLSSHSQVPSKLVASSWVHMCLNPFKGLPWSSCSDGPCCKFPVAPLHFPEAAVDLYFPSIDSDSISAVEEAIRIILCPQQPTADHSCRRETLAANRLDESYPYLHSLTFYLGLGKQNELRRRMICLMSHGSRLTDTRWSKPSRRFMGRRVQAFSFTLRIATLMLIEKALKIPALCYRVMIYLFQRFRSCSRIQFS